MTNRFTQRRDQAGEGKQGKPNSIFVFCLMGFFLLSAGCAPGWMESKVEERAIFREPSVAFDRRDNPAVGYAKSREAWTAVQVAGQWEKKLVNSSVEMNHNVTVTFDRNDRLTVTYFNNRIIPPSIIKEKLGERASRETPKGVRGSSLVYAQQAGVVWLTDRVVAGWTKETVNLSSIAVVNHTRENVPVLLYIQGGVVKYAVYEKENQVWYVEEIEAAKSIYPRISLFLDPDDNAIVAYATREGLKVAVRRLPAEPPSDSNGRSSVGRPSAGGRGRRGAIKERVKGKIADQSNKAKPGEVPGEKPGPGKWDLFSFKVPDRFNFQRAEVFKESDGRITAYFFGSKVIKKVSSLQGAWASDEIPVGAEDGINKSFALDRNGAPVVAYFKEDRGVEFARWNGKEWRKESVARRRPELMSIAFDSQNRPAIALMDSSTAEIYFYKRQAPLR